MIVHVPAPQRAGPLERCFELFRMQNSQNFPGLRPWTPLAGAYSAPRLPSCATVLLHVTLVENHPQKIARYGTALSRTR